ncbi:MAG: ThuA domain-containing protein [Planctomycetota bacterium]|nr:ThuA domain-containing protein [Planctomycetota bacterium]
MSIRRRTRLTCLWAPILTIPLLAAASPAQAETIWIPASAAQKLSGPLVFGQKTGIVEDGALGDFLVSTVCVTPDKVSGGYAEFQVRIPTAATWYVWARLRYPLGGVASFAVIPAGEEPTVERRRALGNSGLGTRQWHWDSQGTGAACSPGQGRLRVDLPAGDGKFRVYVREADDSVFQPGHWTMGRPMFLPRLNLLCLTTDPTYVPTDADAKTVRGVQETPVDPERLRVKSVAFPHVAAGESQAPGKKPIPDWLRCPRFYTKDTWRNELGSRHAGDLAFMVRQIAANEGAAFRLSVLWGGEAYFQSEVAPHAPRLGSLDYLREAVDAGARTGVKIVMYVNPNTVYTDHRLFPEVAVRRANGDPTTDLAYGVPDARYVCINHPRYRDFLARLLTEAFTKYELAGLYVDGLTPHRCFCEHCREKYRRMFGEPLPVEKLAAGRDWCVLWEMVSQPEPVGDPNAPETKRYVEFLYRSLSEVTQLVSATVKRARPEAVTLFHSWPKPDTGECYDGTLTEIYVGHPWRHKLWKFGELANYSNIFPVPVLFNIYLHEHGTEAEARTKMIQGLANGCYPNCWNLVGMQPMFRFMRENAECFDFLRTQPTRFLALPRRIHDGAAQQRIAARKDAAGKPVHDRFLAPYVGLYSAVTRRGLPVVTLQSADFHRQLDGFQVLCLANEACLSDEQATAVRKFVAAGGGLIATHETSLYDENGQRRDEFALAELFGVRYRQTLPAAARTVHVADNHAATAGLNAAGLLSHDDVQLVVDLAGGASVAELAGRDGEPKSSPAMIVRQFGAGRVVYLPGRWDAIQCDHVTPAIEQLFAGAVRWVAGDRLPVQVTAAAPVGVTLLDQPDRRLLHLVNLNGDTEYRSDRIQPIDSVRVRLQIPAGRPVRQLRRLWQKADIPFEIVGTEIGFTVENPGEYEVVVAEF